MLQKFIFEVNAVLFPKCIKEAWKEYGFHKKKLPILTLRIRNVSWAANQAYNDFWRIMC